MPRLLLLAFIAFTIIISGYSVYASEVKPLIKSTDNGNYKVELSWEPVEISPNRIVVFNIKITPLSSIHSNVITYDFIVKSNDGIIKEVNDVRIIDGLARHTVEFPSAGEFSVIINVNKSDSVTFNIVVATEFPSSIVITVLIISLTIILGRIGFKINNLYGR